MECLSRLDVCGETEWTELDVLSDLRFIDTWAIVETMEAEFKSGHLLTRYQNGVQPHRVACVQSAVQREAVGNNKSPNSRYHVSTFIAKVNAGCFD